MERALHVLVLEHGSSLTHDLTLACRSSDIAVLGPVRQIEAARAALHVATVDVLAIEIHTSGEGKSHHAVLIYLEVHPR